MAASPRDYKPGPSSEFCFCRTSKMSHALLDGLAALGGALDGHAKSRRQCGRWLWRLVGPYGTHPEVAIHQRTELRIIICRRQSHRSNSPSNCPALQRPNPRVPRPDPRFRSTLPYRRRGALYHCTLARLSFSFSTSSRELPDRSGTAQRQR